MDKQVESESVEQDSINSYNMAYREKLLQDQLQEVKHQYILQNFNSNVISSKLNKFGNDLFFVRMYDILDSLYSKYNSRICRQMNYKELETQLQSLMCECLNFIIETYNQTDNETDNVQHITKILKESMGRY